MSWSLEHPTSIVRSRSRKRKEEKGAKMYDAG
jgi:hypothetical protein